MTTEGKIIAIVGSPRAGKSFFVRKLGPALNAEEIMSLVVMELNDMHYVTIFFCLSTARLVVSFASRT